VAALTLPGVTFVNVKSVKAPVGPLVVVGKLPPLMTVVLAIIATFTD